MTLIALAFLGLCAGFNYIAPLTTSTPEQRIWLGRIIRRALDESREKQGTFARYIGMDEGQLTKTLQGAGRFDFALVLDIAVNRLPGFGRALLRAAAAELGDDPEVERIANAVADRVAARLGEIKPRMARATLPRPAEQEAVCQ